MRLPLAITLRVAPAIVVLLSLAACGGEEVVQWDAQYVRVTVTGGAKVSRLAFGLMRRDGVNAPFMRPAAGETGWELAPPSGVDLAKDGVLIKLSEPKGAATAWLRGVAYDGDKLVAAGVVLVDTRAAGQLRLTLRVDDPCDLDHDGARDCKRAGCCAADEPADCDDNAATGAVANPWIVESGCDVCGNGIDEDCDGADLSCPDTDKDGHPDCKEAACGPDAAKIATVYPGAPERCDGLDNDCDGKTDEDLPYAPIDPSEPAVGLGVSCGLGACAGGKTACMTDSSGLYCTSHTKKAAVEDCATPEDDNCNGKINEGCNLDDPDGDGVPTPVEVSACAAPLAALLPEFHPGATEGCCLTYTALVLQLAPDWQPGKPIPAGAKPTTKMLQICDLSCDGKITPCDPEDEDGDGVVSPLDCDDGDPLRFPGAPERCGDGVLQSCLGSDPSCVGVADKDGDGWPDDDDCAPDDKARHPGGVEVCNGLDDDCNGVIDDGALAGAPCTGCTGSKCVKACLHVTAAPPSGVCAFTPWQPTSGTCLACVPTP
mgnify:CR=1 FL=1